MEPAIPVGSLVVVKPADNYKTGDVITFGKDNQKSIPTTHRVVDVRIEADQKFFMTKGDANEDADRVEVPESNIIGKVLFSLPYIGYVLDFARKPIGFAFLIGLPALVIIGDEIYKIFIEIKKMASKKKDESEVEN